MAKNRHGGTGSYAWHQEPEFQRDYREWAEEWEESEYEQEPDPDPHPDPVDIYKDVNPDWPHESGCEGTYLRSE